MRLTNLSITNYRALRDVSNPAIAIRVFNRRKQFGQVVLLATGVVSVFLRQQIGFQSLFRTSPILSVSR
jgi:hypothetical protein